MTKLRKAIHPSNRMSVRPTVDDAFARLRQWQSTWIRIAFPGWYVWVVHAVSGPRLLNEGDR